MKSLPFRAVPALAFSLLLASQLPAQSSPQQAALPGAIPVAPADFGLFPHSGRTKMQTDPFITLNAAFTPDGNTVYFSKSLPGWTTLTIFTSHRTPHGWSAPAVAAFSGVYRDTDPVVTPDGKSVIFASTRPPIGHLPYSYGLYQAPLTGPGAGKAVPLSAIINEPGTSNLYPSLAADGTLYFIRPVGKAARIFRATSGPDGYRKAQQLSFPGDADSVSDSDAVIESHQRFLIFTSNRPDSAGSMDIYLAFRHGDAWCKPIHLDASINTAAPELAPGLSPDGRTLYFASSRNDQKQPRDKLVDAAGFIREAASYENGSTRIYRANIGPWLDAHAKDAAACSASS